MQLNQVTVPVTDIERAVLFYTKIGLRLIVLSTHYARFAAPGNNATFSIELTKNFVAGNTVVYFEFDELDETVRQLKEKGVEFNQDPTDQPWLWREAYLDDPDGNKICFYHAGNNRLFPPWRIN